MTSLRVNIVRGTRGIRPGRRFDDTTIVDFVQCTGDLDIGRPKKNRTPEEEAARLEARRTSKQESARRLGADQEYPDEAAAAKRQRIADDSEFPAHESEQRRLNDYSRRASDPGYRVMENFQR